MMRVRTSYRAVAVIALAVVVGVAPVPASWIEQIYSREIYLVGQQVLTSLSSFFSVAVLDVMAVLGLVGFIYWWVRALRVNVQESRMRIIAKMCLNTVATVAVLYLIFMVLWGFNYRRQPLVAKLDYDATRISSTGLLDFSNKTVRSLKKCCPDSLQITLKHLQWAGISGRKRMKIKQLSCCCINNFILNNTDFQ